MAPTELTKQLKRKRGDNEEEQDDDVEQSGAGGVQPKASKPYKQRVLVLSSRGITQRQRHLMMDISALLPHSKRDAKLDSKHHLPLLNELCDLASCNNALFFEARRKHGDLYLWAAKAPNGPSIRFHVLNAHTMDEMKMTGNCLKGSRPVVVFDKAFDEEPHWQVIKEVLTHIFAVPKTARRVKPFIDHVINFSIADGKIWFRNYQILDAPPLEAEIAAAAKGKGRKVEGPKISLSEIGPRFVLNPIKIFEGSFNGATIYENKEFVSSSSVSTSHKTARASKYKKRKGAQDESKVRHEEIEKKKPKNKLETRSVFA